MSASLIPEAQKGATEEQTSVQKMLIENGRLIEAIAEYQRLGRPTEAMKYQDLLHRNLLYLGRLVDPQLAQQIQNIRVPPVVEPPSEAQQQQPPSSSTQPQQPPVSSPQQQQQQIQPPQMMNGTMAPPSSHHPQQYPMNGGPGMPPHSMIPSGPPPHNQTPPMQQMNMPQHPQQFIPQ